MSLGFGVIATTPGGIKLIRYPVGDLIQWGCSCRWFRRRGDYSAHKLCRHLTRFFKEACVDHYLSNYFTLQPAAGDPAECDCGPCGIEPPAPPVVRPVLNSAQRKSLRRARAHKRELAKIERARKQAERDLVVDAILERIQKQAEAKAERKRIRRLAPADLAELVDLVRVQVSQDVAWSLEEIEREIAARAARSPTPPKPRTAGRFAAKTPERAAELRAAKDKARADLAAKVDRITTEIREKAEEKARKKKAKK